MALSTITSATVIGAPVSTPNRAEITIADDGGGGQLSINAVGLNGANQLDLKTFFGAAAFKSIPLAARMAEVVTTQAQLNAAFRDISVTITSCNSTPTKMPGFAKSAISATAGCIVFFGPSVAGTWTVVIELRNSIIA